MTSGLIPPKEPETGDSSQTSDSPRAEESPEPSAGERRRRRSSGVVASLVIAGALLVLGFSPVSRLAAHGLPRAPGSIAPVVTAPQHGNTTAVQAVPAGLPSGARIRTAADVFPYAVAALGPSDALALMALLDSKSYLAGNLEPLAPSTPTSTRLSRRCSTRRRRPASLPGRPPWGRRLPCWPRSRRATLIAQSPSPRPSSMRPRPPTAC